MSSGDRCFQRSVGFQDQLEQKSQRSNAQRFAEAIKASAEGRSDVKVKESTRAAQHKHREGLRVQKKKKNQNAGLG